MTDQSPVITQILKDVADATSIDRPTLARIGEACARQAQKGLEEYGAHLDWTTDMDGLEVAFAQVVDACAYLALAAHQARGDGAKAKRRRRAYQDALRLLAALGCQVAREEREAPAPSTDDHPCFYCEKDVSWSTGPRLRNGDLVCQECFDISQGVKTAGLRLGSRRS